MILKNIGIYFLVIVSILGLASCNYNFENHDNDVTTSSEVITSISTSEKNHKKSSNIESSSNSVIQTEDLQLVTIYHFFNHYFDTYTQGEVQDFTGILEENDETLLFINFLEYQLYKQTKTNMCWKSYSFKLTDVNKKQDKNQSLISINCEVEFVLSDAEDESGAVIPYKFTLKETDDKWIITNIEEESGMPNFLETFRKQVNDLADKNKTREENIKEATQYLMDNYE